MTKKKRPEKETLEKLIAQGLSQAQIGKRFGVTRTAVEGWYRKYGLVGQRRFVDYSRVPDNELPLYRRRDWLENEYVHKERSTYDIACELNVDPVTIQKALHALSIPLRHEAEMPAPYKDEQWLRHQYIDLGKTFEQIGKEENVKPQTIWKWAKRFDIQSRDWNEEKANHVSLSQEALEFISGELLGDMSITMNGAASARIDYSSKYRVYLEWLAEQLAQIRIKPQRIAKYSTNWGEHFLYSSKAYRELTTLRERWYPDGKKHVPSDLILTPLIVHRWYVSDGNLVHYPGRTRHIRFATDGFSHDEIAFLAGQLSSLGFQVSTPKSKPIITILAKSVRSFLEWIGYPDEEIAAIYGYKWDLERTKDEWINFTRPRLLEQLSINQEKGGDYNVSN